MFRCTCYRLSYAWYAVQSTQLDAAVMRRAYDEALTWMRELQLEASHGKGVDDRLRFFKPQQDEGKDQYQVPLKVLRQNQMDHADAPLLLPPTVAQVASVFEAIAIRYLRDALGSTVASAASALQHLEKKSVFRIWSYYGQGATCRAHEDPGLCTVLGFGSRPGLEVHGKTRGPSGDGGDVEWGEVEDLMRLERDVSSSGQPQPQALLLNDTTLACITQNIFPACTHRVKDEAMSAADGSPRVNLILEIRPLKNQWYTFQPVAAERKLLEKKGRELERQGRCLLY